MGPAGCPLCTSPLHRALVNRWVSDIRNRQKASRESGIVKLSRLGWTQEEIAEATGLTQQRVQQIMRNAHLGKIHNLLSEGRSMEYIAAEVVGRWARCKGFRCPLPRVL